MSNVNDSLKMVFSKMEDYISTKTVVGEAVHIGDVILIPLVDVVVGMATGISSKTKDGRSSDAESSKSNTSGNGGGGFGAKMSPSAVIVIINGSVQLVNIKNQESVGKLIDMVPGILSKLGLASLFNKKEEEPSGNEDE